MPKRIQIYKTMRMHTRKQFSLYEAQLHLNIWVQGNHILTNKMWQGVRQSDWTSKYKGTGA